MPFDSIYWILLIPVLILSVYAQIKVSSSFSRYSRERSRRGITGAQAAYEVLYEGRDVHAVITDLMQRAKRSERDESYL